MASPDSSSRWRFFVLTAVVILSSCVVGVLGAGTQVIAAARTQAVTKEERLWFHLDNYLKTRANGQQQQQTHHTHKHQQKQRHQHVAAHTVKRREEQKQTTKKSANGLWFHLDDYLDEAVRAHQQAQQNLHHKAHTTVSTSDSRGRNNNGIRMRFRERRRAATLVGHHQRRDEEEEEGEQGVDDEAGQDARDEEQQAFQDTPTTAGLDAEGGSIDESSFAESKDYEGGTTNVLANRNYMSVMEDIHGNPITPSQAAEILKKREDDQKRKKLEEQANKPPAVVGEENTKREQQNVADQVAEASEMAGKTQQAALAAREAKMKTEAAEEFKKKASQVTLYKAWTLFPSTYLYQKPRADVFNDMCIVTGIIRGSKGYIAKLPPNCRPQARLMFNLLHGGLPARVDVTKEGALYYAFGPGRGWLSLTGIAFSFKPNMNEGLTLESRWVPYGTFWRGPTAHVSEHVVMLSGLIKDGTWQMLGSVAPDLAPTKRLAFSVAHGRQVGRVDVGQDGHIVHISSETEPSYISLDGIMYARFGGQLLTILPGWTVYTPSDIKKKGGVTPYRSPRVHRTGNLCLVSGMMTKPGDWVQGDTMATLPASCRPAARLVFGCNVGTASARCDVFPDGKIVYVHGRTNFAYISLDAIHFVPATELPVDYKTVAE